MEGYVKIKVNDTDSLYEIIRKISKDAPSGAPFYLEVEDNLSLKNFLNLKMLLSKYAGKRFAIVTSNKEIRKIGEKLGVRYFVKSDEIEFEEKFSKTNVLRHNFTYFEYLRYELKKLLFRNFFLLKKTAKKTYKNKRSPGSHIFLLLVGVILSFSLLAFIFYFAVSRTYVYIKPELAVKSVLGNIVYSEKDNGNLFDAKNIIRVNQIDSQISYEFDFNVSSIDQKSAKNAYGTVTIYNELNNEQSLKPNSRFMTDDGKVFRSNAWIRVPPSVKDGSGNLKIGTAQVTLIADVYDRNGSIIGAKGNIPKGTLLIMPGLVFNRDKVYAKTESDFKDGMDPLVHVLTKEEYEKFSGLFAEKLKNSALESLKNKIKAMNNAGSTNFQILPIKDVIDYKIGPISTMSGVKIGDKAEEVRLAATGSVSTYVFDKNSVVFYLKTILNDNMLLPSEKLIGVNEDSLRMSYVVNQTKNPFYMKATTEMDVTISYNFEDQANNLTKKLKNLIANTTKKDATSILLNDGNIANVKIEFSPFWLSRVSNNPDNIDFIIEK